MSMALMLAGFDDVEEADAALDMLDTLAVRQRHHLPVLGIVSDDGVTTTTIADPTRPASGMGGTLLRILVELARATPATPTVGGVVWGLACGVGREGVDNPAMRALAQEISRRRPLLVALADCKAMAALETEAAVTSAELHGVPEATSSMVNLMAGLPVEDLARRPVR